METPEGERLMPWSHRLPDDLIKKIHALADYEGMTIQQVQAKVWRMFFDAIGPIPEKKSFLQGPWPGKLPKKLKP